MKGCRVLALAIVVVLSRLAVAWAQPTVVVGGVVVMKFEGDKVMSADARAAMVQAHVDAAIRKRAPVTAIIAVGQKGVFTIEWAGMVLCTVDGVQAKANKCSTKALAFRWVKSLRQAARAGFISVTPDNMVMGVGTTHTAKITGIATGPITVDCDNPAISVSLDGDTITIKGDTLAHGVMHVTRDGVTVSVPVAFKEPAGTIPDSVVQSVTGAPAGHELLEEAVELATHASVEPKPGATVSIKASSEIPNSMDPGTSAVVKLAVAIEGPDYFTVSRIMEVDLKNEAVALQPPTLLMVSNRPEKILGEGVLFQGSFRADQPTRLLYSHVNGLGSTQFLWVNLSNPTDQPARVLVVAADGGPATEELYVGHRCNTRFLEDYVHNEGVVLTMAPHRTYSLGQYRMPPHEIVSGLAQLQLLSGDHVDVSVETSPEVTKGGHIVNVFEAPFNPFRIHPKGIFATPNIQVNQTFVVGSTDSTVEIPFGKSPWLIDPTSGEPNTGNYGVMYEVNLDLQNPTPQSQKVSLFFEPLNGVALGSFLVEGKLMETACLKPPARGLISTVELAPQQNRSIHIITLPQAGSHYPARIQVESAVQQEVTPSEPGGGT